MHWFVFCIYQNSHYFICLFLALSSSCNCFPLMLNLFLQLKYSRTVSHTYARPRARAHTHLHTQHGRVRLPIYSFLDCKPCRMSIGDNSILGDTRWGGIFGIDAYFVAIEDVKVQYIKFKAKNLGMWRTLI